MLLSHLKIPVQAIDDALLTEKQCSLSVLRLDAIHPMVSGNKLFKLAPFLSNALAQHAAGIITFGGAYSNHLVATAFACKEIGLPCIGIVRGEQPLVLSHTLSACLDLGMTLQFLSRADYARKDTDDFIYNLHDQYAGYYIIPEGGFATAGAVGAAEIHQFIDRSLTHIVCATGTATTVAGLLKGAAPASEIIAVPVLKGTTDIVDRINTLLPGIDTLNQLVIRDDYHFGGYAKHSTALIDFMNQLYQQQGLPTDFVYTGKMMFAVYDLLRKNYFPPGSRLMAIHTGGLQGNASLPAGILTF